MKIFGQDTVILEAVLANIVSWFVRKFIPKLLPSLLPTIEQEETISNVDEDGHAVLHADDGGRTGSTERTRCVVIGRPGGVEQLRLCYLKPGIVTCGYNIEKTKVPFAGPLNLLLKNNDTSTSGSSTMSIPSDCVIIRNQAYSVNYADVAIRWGLYESAKTFVGYPIVPGFDVAGIVHSIGTNVQQLQIGDLVFGCTLFGGYSSCVLVPEIQLRKVPPGISMSQAASLPAVSLTALYALFLAGHYPMGISRFHNKSILIHSAAGGVGSMLIQMSKLLGLHPIVGIVGHTTKVQAAYSLGCHVVIDKSQVLDIWTEIHKVVPNGFATVMEPNGVATITQSYAHLAMTGRLIVYGFHTNLPLGQDMLSPLEWIRMAHRMNNMPKFDPMEMGKNNKSVLAFNLSFFANEREMLSDLFDQIHTWFVEGKLECPRVVEMHMDYTAEAHSLLQTGKTIGKLVLHTEHFESPS